MILWIVFAVLSVIICISGYFLSKYADEISELTGLARSWIGATLLAIVTSLPELGTGIGAVTIANAPDLAVGNIMGSCVFNLSILFLIDIMSRKKSLFAYSNQSHILTSIMGITLIGLTSFALILNIVNMDIQIIHIGLSSIVLMITYFIFMKILFQSQGQAENDQTPPKDTKKIMIAGAKFIASALVVIATGFYLPILGDQIVIEMGWNQAFFGTVFLAIATSLPEIVVTISAFHIGAVDLAIGNVLGSNLFNVCTLLISDLFYKTGILFAHVTPIHATTGLLAIIMTSMALLGFVLKPKKQVLLYMTWPTLLIGICYIISMVLLFLAG